MTRIIEAARTVRSVVQVEHAGALDDRVALQLEAGVRVRPHQLTHGEEGRALRATSHTAAGDVVVRPVPRAFEAAILGNASLPKRREQMAAAVGDRERTTGGDAHGE